MLINFNLIWFCDTAGGGGGVVGVLKSSSKEWKCPGIEIE